MRDRSRLLFLVLVWTLLPWVVAAQELPGIGSADTVQASVPAGWRRVTPLGDLRLRGDFVRSAPAGREVDRFRSFLRLGVAVLPLPQLELGAAGEGALGSDRNADNRANNDNETSDDVNLDQLYARWLPRPEVEVVVGRHAVPFQLTPLVWDDDLRPDGGAVAVRLPTGDFDAWRIAAGWFGVRSLADSWTRLAVAQAGYSRHDGGPRGADARFAYLYWDHVDGLVADGLARTNATQAGRFVSDFHVFDVQLRYRTLVGRVACAAHGEWVENLGADAASSAVRGGIAIGDLVAPGHVEVHYSYHRTERDAVLAAFNADDWWFHSRLTGHRAGINVAIGRRPILGISGSLERRDDLATWTKRLLLDLRLGFSP